MDKDHLRAAYLRNLAVKYAWCFVGLPYRYGGDDPLFGFDCSGFVVEVLQAVGRIAPKQDYSADGLYGLFTPNRLAPGEKPYPGCLAFWVDEYGRATHVELCIDEWHTLGAAGGGHSTTTTAAAAAANAFLKLRPHHFRGKPPVFADPWRLPEEKG